MISVDTLEDNTAFARKENADFPILADPTKETAKKYGVLRELAQFGQVPNRWTFYISPEGRIQAIEKKVTPQKAGEEVVAKLQELGVSKKRTR